MFTPTAKVIADSVSPDGNRLTTLEVTLHRFVLAEFNTHRAFSRNSASSRAIPYAKMRAKALETPALPLSWPGERKGMQGGEEASLETQKEFQSVWLAARDKAVQSADLLAEMGLHKSVINRLLEPFLPHTIIVSATNWTGFWAQRCHPSAQPEIRVAAEAMRAAYDASTPEKVWWGNYHLPYINEEEREQYPIKLYAPDTSQYKGLKLLQQNPLLKISAARCARVSYLTHDGKRDLDKDIELFDRLTKHSPPHASPLEHVAAASEGIVPDLFPHWTGRQLGNFHGWRQLRHQLSMN